MVSGKLFFGIMFSDRNFYEKVIEDLIKKFGEIEKESSEYDFDTFTSYYEKEMGKNLIKKIIIFKKKINEEDLINIKKAITRIEKKYSLGGKRKVNIDPGYISKEKVVLASFKKKDFKKDLGKGVYAHEVLRFEEGKVKVFWHTFGDYKRDKMKKFLFSILQHKL
jgi:hypothetical protein